MHLYTFNILCLWLSIIVSSFCYPQSQSQELPIEDILIGEGVQTNVQNIYQDKTGYLWFATWSGLYKYDGYSFISYTHDIDDTTSLFDNTLSIVYEDKEGIIWIGSRFGLERFNPKSETFIHYTPNPSDTVGNRSNEVWAICEDENGVLWVGTTDGLYKFDRETEKFSHLRHDSADSGSISNNNLYAIYKDKRGALWFTTEDGLDRLDYETGKFIHYWKIPIDWYWKFYQTDRTLDILIDEKGIFWIGTSKGLVEFDPAIGTYTNYLYDKNNPLNHITSISQDVVSGSLWLATTDGLFSFDKKSKKFTHYNLGECNYIFMERSGTLWFGTETGIKKLNRIKQPFKSYPLTKIAYFIQNGRDGILWIFHSDIIWEKFDIRKDHLVPYSFGKNRLFYVWNSGEEVSLRTKDGGLFIQDTLGNIKFFMDASWKEYLGILSSGLKTDRGYYIGRWQGDFDLWEPETNRVLKIKNLQQAIYYIFEDSIGLLWIATYMGKLFRYNPLDNSFKEFIIDIKDPSSLSGKRINQIYEDKKGRLWFATITGLNILEQSTNTFIRYTTKNGLASDNIRGILEDDHGNLWLNTTKGISKFDAGTNQFKNYDISYGLEIPTDYYYGVGCKTRNGEMYFPGVKGFTRFHPDSIKDNPFIPPIVITSFKKFDKSYPFSSEIRLPYDENFISFEFAALSYISNERNQYAYKLEGLDKDWVYSGTRRYASYPNLDPGEYVFRVKGSNNDGVWNKAGASILIIISPPWWKTNTAYILYSLLILSLIYITWKMQVKRIRMSHEYEMSKFEAEKLHEVDELKSRFFANISHEFRTPLTLILGPVKQIIERTKEEKTRDDLKVVHKNANRLLELVNQLLDISKLESGKMNLQTIPQNIITLLKALVLSFTSYAERKRITLKFDSTEDEIIAYIDNDKIEKIITNLLSNALKFTPEGGTIEVTVTRSYASPFSHSHSELDSEFSHEAKKLKQVQLDNSGSVEISIRDSGIGIPKDQMEKIFDRFYQVDGSHTREQEGTGIGLSLTKELIELHKGRIEIESEEGKGTNITISIPLGKEHLKPEEICEKSLSQTLSKGESFFEELIIIEKTRTEKDEIDLLTERGKPLLLIVEDNSDVRNYIKSNLNKGYIILEALDGLDGWNKSIEHTPDLIVSDVMMPKMNGFQLCNKIKTDERTSHIPIILLTAKASSKDKIEGYETGADDYIMKPFEPDELRARIKNLIEQRKRIHEHIRKLGIIELEQSNITSIDKKFLQKAFEIINQKISDTAFGLETFAELLSISRSVLHRKITSLTGESPGELIRRIRLKRASQLIEQNFGNMSEISLEVGFSNPSQFARSFQKQFGVSPSVYQQKFTNK